VNALQLTLLLKVFTQRNFVADFLQKIPLLHKNGNCAYLAPFGGLELGLTYMYAVHLRLIGKPVVDFLFSLDVTAEALRANIDWKSCL